MEGNTDSARSGPRAADKVPAVRKALAVVRFLNASASTGAALHEVAGALAITKSHCHNILKVLADEGWVAYDAGRRRYTLAPRLISDIAAVIGRTTQPAQVHDELVRLSRATGLPCVLTRVEPDGCFVAVDKAEEVTALQVSVPIGHRFPYDAPAQMRARIAWLPRERWPAELDRWRPQQHTATTITDRNKLVAELRATRRRGYAISWAELNPGVMSLAVPIFDAFGQAQLILQCPGLQATVETRRVQVARELQQSAQTLNRLFVEADAGAGPRQPSSSRLPAARGRDQYAAP